MQVVCTAMTSIQFHMDKVISAIRKVQRLEEEAAKWRAATGFNSPEEYQAGLGQKHNPPND